MKKELLYPIKFMPILQEKIWGGKKLKSKFNKKSESDNIGESWELSGVAGFISTVSNGSLKGSLLTELIKDFKEDFVGQKVYKQFGDEFPLLFKYIDAADDLSIQLHPNDKLAKERHDSLGKTEMWYVIDADPNSIFVKNAPSFAGIGVGSDGFTTFTIATPTGEGTTSARSFARLRRCVLNDAFSIR